MKIEDILIGIGLFSMIVVVFLAFTANIASNYANAGIDIPIDENASGIYSQASQINDLSMQMQDKLVNTQSGNSNVVTAFIYGAWSTLVLSFNSLAMSVTLITNIAALFSLPPALVMFLVSSIIILLVVTIAYMVFSMGSGS